MNGSGLGPQSNSLDLRLSAFICGHSSPRLELLPMAKKQLRVGMIGYGFMGRAHSNAYKQVGQFFPSNHEVVLKAACARDAAKIKAFAEQWGYESTETDWRKLVARPDI